MQIERQYSKITARYNDFFENVGHVYLMGVPEHNNLGDYLITKGLICMLEQVGLEYSLYEVNKRIPKFETGSLVIIRGGGWLGDAGICCQEYILNIIRKADRVVFGGMSGWFDVIDKSEYNRLDAACKVYFCARDKKTFDRIYTFNRVSLMPDDATLLWTKLKDWDVIGDKEITIARSDKEKKHNWLVVGGNLETDWFREGINIDNCLDILHEIFLGCKKMTTDRLHSALISSILGVETVIIDNSYGKCRSYYDTWLQDMKHVTLCENP